MAGAGARPGVPRQLSVPVHGPTSPCIYGVCPGWAGYLSQSPRPGQDSSGTRQPLLHRAGRPGPGQALGRRGWAALSAPDGRATASRPAEGRGVHTDRGGRGRGVGYPREAQDARCGEVTPHPGLPPPPPPAPAGRPLRTNLQCRKGGRERSLRPACGGSRGREWERAEWGRRLGGRGGRGSQGGWEARRPGRPEKPGTPGRSGTNSARGPCWAALGLPGGRVSRAGPHAQCRAGRPRQAVAGPRRAESPRGVFQGEIY